jgi:hypothetical protein
MHKKHSAPFLVRALAGTILASASVFATAQTPATPHVFFRVKLADSAPGPVSGRLLVFLKKGTGDKEVNIQEFRPGETSVAAREVHHLMPGAAVDFYADGMRSLGRASIGRSRTKSPTLSPAPQLRIAREDPPLVFRA